MRRAALALALAGCAFEPEGAMPMDPPAIYRTWWDSAQACTGRKRDFDAFRFYVVPGESFDYQGRDAGGARQGGRIYIAEPYVLHPMVVRHEMIHALGIDGHPDKPFKDPCHATWDTYTSNLYQ